MKNLLSKESLRQACLNSSMSIEVFIYSSGKTASTSLYNSFCNLGVGSIHVHSQNYFESTNKKDKSLELNLEELIYYCRDIQGKVVLIDVFREPISRKISSFFQRLENLDFIKEYNFSSQAELVDYFTENIKELVEIFNEKYLVWIENYYSFNEYGKFGFDINKSKFNFDKKSLFFSKDNIDFIVVRFDDIKYWEDIFRGYGFSGFRLSSENRTQEKSLGSLHKLFMKNLVLHKHKVDQVYFGVHDKYLNIFYSDKELYKNYEFWLNFTTKKIDVENTAGSVFFRSKSNHYSRYSSGEKCAKNRLKSITVPHSSLNFQINEEAKIFAIGSCFARNIEEALSSNGVDVESLELKFPYTPNSSRQNGIMNKYNAGVINQSIKAGLIRGNHRFNSIKRLMKIDEGNFLDPFFKPGESPKSLVVCEEAIAKEVDYFSKISYCDVVFITLGMIEVWYDNLLSCYINQPPHPRVAREYPTRYSFFRMSVEDVYNEISESINILSKNGINNIIITTSPVALNRTFTNDDVINANCYSKSVLRVACEKLSQDFDIVDYFPSYEAIIYGDRNLTLQSDFSHASDYAVNKIISTFVSRILIKEDGRDDGSEVRESSTEIPDNELYELRKMIDRYKNILVRNNISLK